MKLRVLSYNIHKGKHWSGAKHSLSDIKKIILSSKADIVFLQEIVGEKTVGPDKDTPQLEYLADSIWPHFSYGKNAVYTKGHHGNAILSKFPILKTSNFDLSLHKLEQRGLLHAQVELDLEERAPKVLDLFCTHLNLLNRDREKQFKLISDYLKTNLTDSNPIIFAGDFNDWNKKSHIHFSEELNFTECFLDQNGVFPKTFPSFYPILSLDRIYSKDIKIMSAQILKTELSLHFSDHLPLLVEFEF